MPMRKAIQLTSVSKEDVTRIKDWLKDTEISENWFGRYTYGDPAHTGYHPDQAIEFTDEKWEAIFNNEDHPIFSVKTEDNTHIGEVHLVIDPGLGDAQISVLIGDKTYWHQGYGTSATLELMKKAFNELKLFRIWVDIPVYNENALAMFKHIGFVHEGTLRKSRPHFGSRFDSVVMGLLANEYNTSNDDLRIEGIHAL